MSSIPAAKERLAACIFKHTDESRPNVSAGDVRALLAELSRLEEETANLKLDRDMWKGLAGKLDAKLAEAGAERDAAPGGWVKDHPAPSIDPKGPTITHAQLCRLSQAYHRADGTYDNDGFAINEWLKHRLALSAEVASLLSKGESDER